MRNCLNCAHLNKGDADFPCSVCGINKGMWKPSEDYMTRQPSIDTVALGYAVHDAIATELLYKRFNIVKLPKIENVIFNDPATIVFWSDKTKTVVKASGDDVFDPEKGLAMAISKKALGNQGNYYEEIKKWVPKQDTRQVPEIDEMHEHKTPDQLRIDSMREKFMEFINTLASAHGLYINTGKSPSINETQILIIC